MSFLYDARRFIGRTAVNLECSDFFGEIGEGAKQATVATVRTVGDLAAGVSKTVAGMATNNESLRRSGVKGLSHVMEYTANRIEKAVVQTAVNSKDFYLGLVDGDRQRMLKGGRELAKKVIIGGVAITVFELADSPNSVQADEVKDESPFRQENQIENIGVFQGNEESYLHTPPGGENEYFIETVNSSLEGDFHEVSGVYFSAETVELPNGDFVSGVYPDFQEQAAVVIPESIYFESDYVQFEAANQVLASKIALSPELGNPFNSEQLEQIQAGETPDGYVWHHHQEPGRLELVEEEVHAMTGHTGGRFIWGGGTEYR
ncbi:HNH endonuclease [Bacillus sp. JJ1474]|uniref:HNH endonuclease n=1 Tax=Bacillus sp. JJ1474 TaxID=3122955 RepID=UPI002FFE15C0